MPNSFPSPVSDESSSEGTPLREFVNETIAQEQQQATSPRLAVLSQASLHERPHDDHDLNKGVLKPPRSSRHSGSERRKRERDLTKANNSDAELVRLLVDQEQEASKLRKALRTAMQVMEAEAQRVSDLEKANQAASRQARDLIATRLAAEQEANKANQELRVYHIQLENVQKEAERTQQTLREIERQRDEAEEAAARARAKTRKLHQQKMIAAAREEGRRLGFEAGFDHARRERQMVAARSVAGTRPSRRGSGPAQPEVRGTPRSVASRASRHPSRSGLPPAEPPPVSRPQDIDDDHASLYESPTSPELSPTQLPLRNLPDGIIEQSIPPETTANGTPLRPYQPPPTTGERTPIQSALSLNQHQSQPPLQPPLRSQTPSIQRFAVDFPPPEQLAQAYRPKERLSDSVVTTRPREEWVPASTFDQMSGSASPHHSVQQPQEQGPTSLLPPAQRPVPAPQRPTIPPPKPISRLFSIGKQQAQSWYRTFSLRKKKKAVIDPTPEEQPPANTVPRDDAKTVQSEGTDEIEPIRPPAQSWYKRTSAPPSVRSHDYGFVRHRPTSDAGSVSTRVSQFDLLATPHQGFVPSNGIEAGSSKRVREKDSLLSVIKEDPASRGNTPSTDRFLSAGGKHIPRMGSDHVRSTSSGYMPQQALFSAQPLHQQHSRSTMNSATPSRRRGGLTIDPPEPDAPLDYSLAVPKRATGYGGHNKSSSSLIRIPSKISERTTPDTSIGIEIVPPSGLPLQNAASPPHTGVNHLSPYHTYGPPGQQSVTSFRSNRGASPQHASASNGFYGNPLSPTRGPDYAPQSPTRTIPKTPKSVSSNQQPQIPHQTNASRPSLAPVQELTAHPPIQRTTSNNSLRSTGSFGKYDPGGYTDPAFWGPNGPGDVFVPPPQPLSAGSGVRAPSRAGSVTSGLSYV